MPITGKFVADFASFQDAVQKATVSLKGMETQGNTVSTSLNKMVDQFSGRKIIQDAELMSQAFTHLAEKGIGLTNRELERMGNVANEAIAKLRAGGEQVPPGMQRIADAAAKIKSPLDQASSSGSSLFTSLKNVAGVLGVAFSVGALTNFVGKVFDAASTIGDLSDQLGISAEAAQRFKFAAEQSGSTLDAVGTAISFMNKTLATGDKSTVGALHAAGLEFQNIRNLNPQDAFIAIADAVKGIEDPMEQARIVTELFGRSAAELLPAIKAGIMEVGAQTTVMSDSTVRDLKRAQDAWSALGNWVTVTTGTMIADTAGAVAAITKSWQNFAIFAGNAIQMGPGVAAAMASITESAAQMEKVVPWAIKKEIEALVELGGTAKNIGVLFPGLEKEAQKFADSLMRGKPIIHDTAEALAAAAKSTKELQQANELIATQNAGFVAASYAGLVKNILAYNEANIKALQTVERLGLKVEDFGKRVDVNVSAFLAWNAAINSSIPVISALDMKIGEFGQKVNVYLPEFILKAEAAAKKAKEFRDKLGDVATAITQMGLVAGGAFGAVAAGLATVINGANTALKSIDAIKAASKAGFSVDGILGMASGISGLISVAITAINLMKKLFSLGGPSEEQLAGRQAIADFHAELDAMLTSAQRAEAGNEAWKIDVIAIRDAYLAAGKTMAEADAAVQKLWKSAEGGSESAKRAIEEIRKVMGKNTEATEEATAATEEQAQATIETASQATKALEELGPRLKTNEGEWKSWGDIVTGEIQRIANAVRAMQIPSGSGMSSGGGFQSSEDARRQGGAATPTVYQTKTTILLDGDVVGEAMARRVVGP